MMAEAIQLIKQVIMLIIFLDCVLQTMTTSAAQHPHHFMVEEDFFKRLCISKNILTVNKQFPGPTIYAHGGETVVVDVENKGKNNITISWRGGRHLRLDPHHTAYQWLIEAGTSIRKNITLSDDADGTLWWHAKDMRQSATVHGALIIYPKPGTPYPFPKPYEEIPIILGQWWKRDVHEIVSEYIASDGKLPNSDAFTINGQPGDLYPCSNNETFKIEVETGKSYLLRLINAAVGKTLVFGIADHKLKIVGINGWHTKPMSSMVDYVEIKTQHSIDCILEANQQPDHYYMAAREYSSYINMDYDHNTTTTAIVKYKGKYVPSSPPSLPVYLIFHRHTPANLLLVIPGQT